MDNNKSISQQAPELLSEIKGDITKVITDLTNEWIRLFDTDLYHINSGDCFRFADDVVYVMQQQGEIAIAHWNDEMPDCTETEQDEWGHCFVQYKGRFYDSYKPDGVEQWRNLPSFQ